MLGADVELNGAAFGNEDRLGLAFDDGIRARRARARSCGRIPLPRGSKAGRTATVSARAIRIAHVRSRSLADCAISRWQRVPWPACGALDIVEPVVVASC